MTSINTGVIDLEVLCVTYVHTIVSRDSLLCNFMHDGVGNLFWTYIVSVQD